MGKKKIKFVEECEFELSISKNTHNNASMSIEKFLSLHESFVAFKALEGLAPRTLDEHKVTMKYFEKYLETDERSICDRYVDIDVFRAYIAYIMLQKNYKPCTINIRLRTLKCYLKWLHEEHYLPENFSKKLKLVKVPQDTIRPLSDIDVRKMLKTADRSTYSGFRDFTIMILMLDCGIRVGEASMLKIEDIDLKSGIINIKAENAKTRVLDLCQYSRHKKLNFLCNFSS